MCMYVHVCVQVLLFNDILIVASRVPFAADKLKFEEQLEMVASAGRGVFVCFFFPALRCAASC